MQAVSKIDEQFQLLLSIEDISALTRMGRATIYRKMDRKHRNFDPTFPRPIDVGVATTLWRYNDIKEWVLNRPCKAMEN